VFVLYRTNDDDVILISDDDLSTGDTQTDNEANTISTVPIDASSSTKVQSDCPVISEELLKEMFKPCLSEAQISAIMQIAGSDRMFEAMECLLTGPTLTGIIDLITNNSSSFPTVTISTDDSDSAVWASIIAFYKNPKVDNSKWNISVDLTNKPAIDIGGVRHIPLC